jgi:hypothetical protein
MSAREDQPRYEVRLDVWLAGPDDVVYVINHEVVARLRAELEMPSRSRPRKRNAPLRRRDHAAAMGSRS